MNGQFQALPLNFSKTSAGGLWRLFVALVCSCLLHAIVYLLSDLVAPGRYAVSGGTKGRPYALSATLLATAHSSPEAPLSGAAPADSLEGSDAGTETEKAASNDAPPAGGLPLPEVIYYPTSQLSIGPKALTQVELDAPEIRYSTASGRVVLNLWINESGEVAKASMEITELPEPVTTAIVEAFRKLRFKPGELDGRVVGSVMKIEAGL